MNNEQGKSAVRELREALTECIHRCNHCFTGCLMEDDVKMMAECIRLDRDCIEVCAMALKFLYKGSRFQREVLMLCKNVCIVCGEECAKYPQMDHCQRSAEACRVAAEKIDAFLSAHAEAHAAKGSSTGMNC
ncbi:MAG: four-helix bundle copper-binding protein [Rikenellaceae bacterium]|nr:four-helix bundle copper-binding protein [Rikenellaceae bacterium]